MAMKSSVNGPIFHELKKHASFFLKEKIKTARLALTDVTPAQLLAEEATNGNEEGPDARTLKMISRAAFEVDDYWRIVDILHKRFVRFEESDWRASYKAVIVLEHLLSHGPERVAEEFQCDRDVISQMHSFHYIDHKGFDWGMNVRKKSVRVVKLLEKGPLLKEERDKARKVSRGIQGFGSFCIRTSSAIQRSNSESESTHHTNHENLFLIPNQREIATSHADSKENMAPKESILKKELDERSRDCTGEEKPLLSERKPGPRIKTSVKDHHHPFEAMSLLSGADELQAY